MARRYFARVANDLWILVFGILVDYSVVRNQKRRKLVSRCAHRIVSYCNYDVKGQVYCAIFPFQIPDSDFGIRFEDEGSLDLKRSGKLHSDIRNYVTWYFVHVLCVKYCMHHTIRQYVITTKVTRTMTYATSFDLLSTANWDN